MNVIQILKTKLEHVENLNEINCDYVLATVKINEQKYEVYCDKNGQYFCMSDFDTKEKRKYFDYEGIAILFGKVVTINQAQDMIKEFLSEMLK